MTILMTAKEILAKLAKKFFHKIRDKKSYKAGNDLVYLNP